MSHRVTSHRGGNELRESVYNTCISADVIFCALAKKVFELLKSIFFHLMKCIKGHR